MNNRIRELAQQTDIYCDQNFHNSPAYNLQWEQKFAELIVRECLSQVDKVDAMLNDDKEKTGVAWVGLAIAKHFGVEE